MTTASFELGDLDGRNGFALNGINAGDSSGYSVSGAGDVNGDGFDDLIIGGPNADPNGTFSGESYVVFGSDAGFDASLELADLDGSNGFVLEGTNVGFSGTYSGGGARSGTSVSGGGDIDGDGIDDLIIGAPGQYDTYSQTYVVFGQSGGFDASLDLATLDGTSGFVLNSIDEGDRAGFSVSDAGDLNGDGIDDLIIGAPYASRNANFRAGESYVVFGQSEGFDANFNFAELDGSNGFVVNGINAYDNSGISVSSAGDINGDGFDDAIIGAPYADPNGGGAGSAYVVFGQSGEFNVSIDPSDFNGNNGFAINGIGQNDRTGISVTSAGDINNDGIDDVIIGARGADSNGKAYVVFGDSGVGSSGNFELSSLDGSNGFTFNLGDGEAVSGAGDVNGDGINDVIIGDSGGEYDADNKAGESYIVFGSSDDFPVNFDLADLDGSNGFVLEGVDENDFSGDSVSGAGDIDGDGFDDLIVGAPGADPNGQSSGQSYVVFGFNTINGTPDRDRLVGTSTRDHINGLDGNDTIIGRAGDDTLDGGAGSDRLFGNDGYDSLLGGDGRDFLVGGRDDDLLDGGADNDSLFGGRDADQFVLREGDGRDTIFDYRDGTDSFLLDGGLAFEDLTITQGFGQSLISVTDTSEDLASLLGVNANDIGAEDFSTLA